MKLNNIIMPEVRKIQDKYKDKRNDQEAMLKMQAETKAVYEKYGTSQMGGCIQMLIQFPILMAMYRVIQYIPMYVGQLKNTVCQHFDRNRRRYHECFRLCGYYGGKLQDDGQNDKCGLG